MGMTRAAQRAVLSELFGRTDVAEPATWYLALFTVAPTNSGGGTECTGGSYVRKAVTNNTTNFPAAGGGDPATSALAVAHTFASPTADWGTAVAWGLFDASSAGTLWYWSMLETPRVINNGDAAPSFAANELSFTQTGV